MSVKLVLLKSGESVLTDLKEIVKDEEIKGYVFENPTGGNCYATECIPCRRC